MSEFDMSPHPAPFLGRGLDVIFEAIDRERDRMPAAAFDHSTREGAAQLALRIERFWRDRSGQCVRCWIQADGFGGTAVRSNLVDGLPRSGIG